jgi:hypothetical protein
LITELLGQDIDHLECMAKGGGVCKFRIKPEAEAGKDKEARSPD